jgi:hypothetical protein
VPDAHPGRIIGTPPRCHTPRHDVGGAPAKLPQGGEHHGRHGHQPDGLEAVLAAVAGDPAAAVRLVDHHGAAIEASSRHAAPAHRRPALTSCTRSPCPSSVGRPRHDRLGRRRGDRREQQQHSPLRRRAGGPCTSSTSKEPSAGGRATAGGSPPRASSPRSPGGREPTRVVMAADRGSSPARPSASTAGSRYRIQRGIYDGATTTPSLDATGRLGRRPVRPPRRRLRPHAVTSSPTSAAGVRHRRRGPPRPAAQAGSPCRRRARLHYCRPSRRLMRHTAGRGHPMTVTPRRPPHGPRHDRGLWRP